MVILATLAYLANLWNPASGTQLWDAAHRFGLFTLGVFVAVWLGVVDPCFFFCFFPMINA